MTYTVIARCARTGQLGIGVATYSLAVGGYCPAIRGGLGAVSTQAFVNLKLGTLALRLLETGFAPAKAMAELLDDDPRSGYRQLGIVDAEGGVAVHTGVNTRPWSGHITGEGFITMGNVLAGEIVLLAMAEAFTNSPAEDLDLRLLSSLEAGRDAGGQQTADGTHLNERSAAVITHGHRDYGHIDLRVDAHDSAVDELRRVHGYTSFHSHDGIGHFNSVHIRWVIAAGKLDHIVGMVTWYIVGPVNGLTAVVQGNQGLGTGTAWRAARLPQGGQHLPHIAPQDKPRGIGKRIQIDGALAPFPRHVRRGITKGANTATSHDCEPVQRGQTRRIKSKLPCPAVYQQPAPAIGQAVVEDAMQSLELGSHMRTMKSGSSLMVDR